MVSGETAIVDSELGLESPRVNVASRHDTHFAQRALRVAVFFIAPVGHVRPVQFEEMSPGAFLVKTELFVLTDEKFLLLFGVRMIKFDIENEVARFLNQGFLRKFAATPSLGSL